MKSRQKQCCLTYTLAKHAVISMLMFFMVMGGLTLELFTFDDFLRPKGIKNNPIEKLF